MTRIRLVANRSNAPAQWTWREDRPIRHESLWGLVHGFCELNRISGDEFRAMFRHKTLRSAALPGYKGRADLRVLSGLDPDALTATLFLNKPELLRLATVASYVFEHARAWVYHGIAAPYLRFCPRCLAEHALHLTTFQFYSVRRCPSHGVLLEHRCPKCRGFVPFVGPTDTGPFSCICRHRLFENGRADAWRIPAKTKGALERNGDWFLNAYRRFSSEHWQNEHDTWLDDEFHRWDSDVPRLSNRVSCTTTIWGLLLRRKMACNFEATCAARIVRRCVTPVNRARLPTHVPMVAKYGAARAVYKAICRRFYRKILRRHRGAIRFIANQSHSADRRRPRGIRLHTFIAVPALAFILWRCYFEQLWPCQLFTAERPSDVRPKWLDFDRYLVESGAQLWHGKTSGMQVRMAQAVEAEAFVRACAAQYFGYFEEALARIEAIRATKSIDHLPATLLDGRHCPILRIAPNHDGSLDILQCWRAKRWLYSSHFREWVERVPSKRELKRWATRNTATPTSKMPDSFDFRWPSDPRFDGYFLDEPTAIPHFDRSDFREPIEDNYTCPTKS